MIIYTSRNIAIVTRLNVRLQRSEDTFGGEIY